MLDASQYKRIRSRIDRYELARKTFDSKRWARGGGYSPAERKAILKIAKLRAAPTNEERSAVEVYEFVRNTPERYFLYIDEKARLATTWTGDKIGDITFGREYKAQAFGGFPSRRVPVTVRAINGRTYYGTYYKSSGDYARVRLAKK